MCGICGIVSLAPDRIPRAEDLLRMRDSMQHRGPDDAGSFIRGGVALGHRRLSIIDLATGQQPIANEDGSVVLVFNGEIYNYLEVRSELISRGHVFATRTDSEVIVHAYEEYGESCLQHFRGMFAFALWDVRNARLFAARDRLGEKPLYYASWDGQFLFGSEIKAILAHPAARREVDPDALDLYLALRYVPGPRTMFAGVSKLQPGHCLTLEGGRLTVGEYWDFSQARTRDISPRDAQHEFTDLLRESIRMRLMSDVPLGVFLSGGVDSSAVVALMSGMVSEPVKTFSVGYAGDAAENEYEYARLVSQRYRTDHHEFRLTADDFLSFLPKLAWHLDEPIADASAIPLYFLSKLAKEHVTVVLSGEGADELLGGYYIYKKMLLLDSLAALPGSSQLAAGVARVAGLLDKAKIKRYATLLRLPFESRYTGVSSVFTRPERARLLGPRFTGHLHENIEISGPYYRKVGTREKLNRLLYLDTKVWLPDELLMKADKMTMATSVELRVPFLDHRLVEYASSLPVECKIRRGETKHILKKAMEPLLPHAVLYRPKKGFPVPISRWFRERAATVREVLLDPRSACSGYFERAALEALIARHERSLEDHSDLLWPFLVFEHWHKAFM